jgi:ferredoxin
MARALTVKSNNQQLENHTASSTAQHESTCTRCGGLMVQDFCLDVLGNIGESEIAAKRCVQCGEVVDSVILHNRQLRQDSTTVQLAGRIYPNNCVTNCP